MSKKWNFLTLAKRMGLAAGSVWAATAMNPAAWAATYSIDLHARAQGKAIAGRVNVEEGREGVITSDGTTVKFVPTRTQDGAVSIATRIFRDDKLVAKPSVVTQLGHSATISQSQVDGREDFNVQLTPSLVGAP